jgi:two-component system, NtrC family, nitrogen regulation response regulator NtrX
MGKRIVIVDDEPNIGPSLKLILEREGYAVAVCRSGEDFRGQAAHRRADAYLLDVKLPDGNGIDLLRFLRHNGNDAPVIMISGHGSIADAVEATRSGAFDFLEKPLARDRVLVVLKNAIEQASLRRENQQFREIVGDTPRMIGSSVPFLNAVEQASRVARSDARVLLLGESGTGKELLAAHIHRLSPVSTGPFIKVNCAAIPTELMESELFGHEKGAFTGATAMRRGKFELADGGTIFFDEVGDLQESAQAKLLRVLQEGEFQRVGGERTVRASVRVIAATNRDLRQLAADGRFREDLYYRLSVVPIRLPALRDRREDVAALAEYALGDFCTRNNFKPKRLDAAVFSVFAAYDWPGNVRELRNTVERMAILTSSDLLTVDSIPLEIRLKKESDSRNPLQETRESAERERILHALEETDWNVSAAARILNIERTNLHKRMRALGLGREKV